MHVDYDDVVLVLVDRAVQVGFARPVETVTKQLNGLGADGDRGCAFVAGDRKAAASTSTGLAGSAWEV